MATASAKHMENRVLEDMDTMQVYMDRLQDFRNRQACHPRTDVVCSSWPACSLNVYELQRIAVSIGPACQ